MANQEIRDLLNEMYEESDEVLVFENPEYDNAIIGISQDDRLIYDHDKMIECLVSEQGWTIEEAIEFIDYNSSFHYSGREPIIMYHLEV